MYHLTNENLKCWHDHGYLHLPCFFNDDLNKWSNELKNWQEAPGKWMKYFERSSSGEKLLCRVENFIEYHEGLNNIVKDQNIFEILENLMGEKAILFKEKINFKLPGGAGFSAHQDAPAFTTFNQKYHVTMMVSIDKATIENGCLELVKGGMHKKGILLSNEDGTIHPDVVKELKWEALETNPGDIVFFDSYIPHRSGENKSHLSRRAMYITYNRASEGDYRSDYYAHKRKVFPPECERIPGYDYSDAGVYNLGNPIEK